MRQQLDNLVFEMEDEGNDGGALAAARDDLKRAEAAVKAAQADEERNQRQAEDAKKVRHWWGAALVNCGPPEAAESGASPAAHELAHARDVAVRRRVMEGAVAAAGDVRDVTARLDHLDQVLGLVVPRALEKLLVELRLAHRREPALPRRLVELGLELRHLCSSAGAVEPRGLRQCAELAIKIPAYPPAGPC